LQGQGDTDDEIGDAALNELRHSFDVCQELERHLRVCKHSQYNAFVRERILCAIYTTCVQASTTRLRQCVKDRARAHGVRGRPRAREREKRERARAQIEHTHTHTHTHTYCLLCTYMHACISVRRRACIMCLCIMCVSAAYSSAPPVLYACTYLLSACMYLPV
jgi:hypothetical protein